MKPAILRPLRRWGRFAALVAGVICAAVASVHVAQHFTAPADYGPLFGSVPHKPLVAINGRVTQLPAGDALDTTTSSAPGLFTYATFIHNWAPSNLSNASIQYATSNDDPGTTITGINSTGLIVGDATTPGASVKICNLAGVADAFVQTFKNLDPRSPLGSRILTPGAGDGARCSVSTSTTCVVDTDCPGGETCKAIDADWTLGTNTCATFTLRKAWLARGDSTHYAWVIENAQTRFNHLMVTNLQLYPALLTNTIVGTVDDYTPACDGTADCSSGNSYTCSLANTAGTGSAACGLAGGTLSGNDYTVIRVQTNASGAKISGLHTEPQNKSLSSIGEVKFLSNAGPGNLTIANHASAFPLDNIDIGAGGTLSDIVLSPNQGVILYRINHDTGSWYVGDKADYYFSGRSVTATDGMEVSGVDAARPLGSTWDTTLLGLSTGAKVTSASQPNGALVAARDTSTYNTTAGGKTVYAVYANPGGSRTAGGNGLINVGVYASASSGDTNQALFTDAGDVILNNAGNGHIDIRSLDVIFRQHQRIVGTAPTLSSCGTSPSAVTGTDTGGFFTTGSATTSCTLTFAATYSIEPDCILAPMGSSTYPTYTVSATAMTMSTVIASTKYHYQCHQLN